MKILKLYSNPKAFTPINFTNGVNIIFGETSFESKKTNGVGKSICIEFINFCLLKKYSESRLSKIPSASFAQDTEVCLDFTIKDKSVTIKRTIEKQNTPTMIIDGVTLEDYHIDEATKYLSNLMFGTADYNSTPSFREMLGLLARDERSEFKSIIKCYDTDKNIPENYSPHLYLLGIGTKLYNEIKLIYKEISSLTKIKSKAKKDIEDLTKNTFDNASAELNDLKGQIATIENEINLLENFEGNNIVREDIINLETEIESLRSRKKVLKYEHSKISFFDGDNYIDENEIEEIYNQFKDGLGDFIKKDLQEVISFKKKIDLFKNSLFDNKKNSLSKEIQSIENQLKKLDKEYKKKLIIIDKHGVLKNLKVTISSYQTKLEEQSLLSGFMELYTKADEDIKAKKIEKTNQTSLFDLLVTDAEPNILSLESQILKLHKYIMGNEKSSLKVEVKDKAQIVYYDFRTFEDGGHSINREQVFLYDVGLLLSPSSQEFHPKLLIHDNLFHVDQDTLVQSLNYLYENSNLMEDKQYILTLNRDKLSEENLNELMFDPDDYAVASFTKTNKFLGIHYQEI
ncbi:MAG: DUF2326 domain-containing protein [Candidatus Cloacimonetes bacterium]|nr:DUF2326 domain-containing protein [Candidatus Cloacimonadota bacterium]